MMLKKIYNRIGGAGIFLGLVSILYIILLILDFNKFLLSLKNTFNTFISIIWILVVVFVLMIISDLIFTKKLVLKLFNKNKKILSWLLIIIAGLVSTGPIYLWYPLLKDLKDKGLENKYIVGFLYNRSIKLPLLPIMISYFGLKYVLILMFLIITFSIINGYLVEYILNHNIM